MTWIKICGITNVEDALAGADAGADALGFVFYERSPRNVTPETVREIVRQLPATIEKVGVFVEESFSAMEGLAGKIGLTGIQRHVRLTQPHHEPDAPMGTTTYIAIRASDLMDDQGRFEGFGWSPGTERMIKAIFLDTGTDRQPGGTGKSFNWKQAAQTVQALQQNFRIVVAGGLSPTNVPEAMRILKPWGVDVSTGVETRPGKKDPEKVRAFISAVRKTDQEP